MTKIAAIEVQGVSLHLGSTPVLSEVGVTVRAGETVALVGPSGSGKTSLLRLMGGMLVAEDGTVSRLGTRLDALSSAARRKAQAEVGFIYQDHQLVPTYRVLQNVLTGAVGRQSFWSALRSVWLPSKAEEQAAHALLERVGIGEKLFAWTSTLSGGQRQRVAMARALYQQPRVMLADEPVASVDPARAAALIQLLVRLAKEDELALVVSLHSEDLARQHFDRVIGLKGGRVVFDAAPDALDDDAFAALYALERV